jgi:hypothetical protein
MQPPDLETRAREIASSPHSFAGRDISAVINELIKQCAEANKLASIAAYLISDESESMRVALEIDGELSTEPVDLNAAAEIEIMEQWLRDAREILLGMKS